MLNKTSVYSDLIRHEEIRKLLFNKVMMMLFDQFQICSYSLSNVLKSSTVQNILAQRSDNIVQISSCNNLPVSEQLSIFLRTKKKLQSKNIASGNFRNKENQY